MINKRLIQDIIPPRHRINQKNVIYAPVIKSNRRAFSAITKLLLASVILIILVGTIPFTSELVGKVYAQVVATITQGNYQLKVFIRDSDTVETTVNDWLASQKNITVDQIKANSYVGNFTVIIRYHSGGSDKISTRIKIFNANTLASIPAGSDETAETFTQNLISSLSSEHNIRSTDILTGNGPWDIFVVYDDEQGSGQNENDIPVDLNSSLEKPAEQNTASTSPESTSSSESTTSPESVTDTNIIDSGATEVAPDNTPAPVPDETSDTATSTTPNSDIQENEVTGQ